MPSLRKPLLAAAAATVLIGGGAWAASAYTHHLQVRLPDGQIAQVDYVGDVAPRVVLQPAEPADAASVPFLVAGFPAIGPIDRIFADMERQQAAMLQQIAAMEHDIAVHGPAPAAIGQHPAKGMVNWSYVSSTTSSNGCTQTVEWNSGGSGSKGAQPQLVRTSSGNCDKAVKDTPIHEVAAVQPPAATPEGKTI